MDHDPQASTQFTRAALPPAAAADHRLRWFGIAIVLAVFGGFGTWAALAPLSSATHAPGVIRRRATLDGAAPRGRHREDDRGPRRPGRREG
jgi:hypothetical protein